MVPLQMLKVQTKLEKFYLVLQVCINIILVCNITSKKVYIQSNRVRLIKEKFYCKFLPNFHCCLIKFLMLLQSFQSIIYLNPFLVGK